MVGPAERPLCARGRPADMREHPMMRHWVESEQQWEAAPGATKVGVGEAPGRSHGGPDHRVVQALHEPGLSSEPRSGRMRIVRGQFWRHASSKLTSALARSGCLFTAAMCMLGVLPARGCSHCKSTGSGDRSALTLCAACRHRQRPNRQAVPIC